MTSSFVCCAVVWVTAGAGAADLTRPVAPTDPAPPAQRSRAAAADPGPAGRPQAPPDHVNPDLIADRERQAHLDRLDAGFEPFDLTYLPRPAAEVPFLFAARPAAVLAHPDLRPLAATADAMLGQLARSGGISTPAGPGLAAVEWVLVGGTHDRVEDPKNYRLGGKVEWLVARTRAPYDWAAAARAWNPRLVSVSYRGTTYLATLPGGRGVLKGVAAVPPSDRLAPLAAAGPAAVLLAAYHFTPSPAREAVYAPDGRTVVVDDEAHVRGLIDRLRDGPPAAAPGGWAAVERGLAAVNFRGRAAAGGPSNPARPGPFVGDPTARVLNGTDRISIAVDGGRPVRVRVVGAWSDPRSQAAPTVAEYARLWRLALHHNNDFEFPVLSRAFIQGRLTLRPFGFEFVADLPDDPFRLLAAEARRRADLADWERFQAIAQMQNARKAAHEPAKADTAPVKPGHEGLPPIPAPPPKSDNSGEYWKRFPAPISTGPKP